MYFIVLYDTLTLHYFVTLRSIQPLIYLISFTILITLGLFIVRLSICTSCQEFLKITRSLCIQRSIFKFILHSPEKFGLQRIKELRRDKNEYSINSYFVVGYDVIFFLSFFLFFFFFLVEPKNVFIRQRCDFYIAQTLFREVSGKFVCLYNPHVSKEYSCVRNRSIEARSSVVHYL